MSANVLYRFFDGAGDLLYVGITVNPPSRLRMHEVDKDWWPEVRQITIEPYEDRTAVSRAEAAAVRTEHPRYNVHHQRVRTQPVAIMVCDIQGCDEPVTARALCRQHYAKWRKYGDPLASSQRTSHLGALELCTIDGCSKSVSCKGWCSTHYRAWRKHGDPLRVLPRGPKPKSWREMEESA